MKTISKLLIAMAIVMSLPSCTSEEGKAFKAIKSSNDLAALREFKAKYDGSMKDKLRAECDTLFNTLVKDSTLYAAFENAEGRPAKFGAASNYIKVLPGGIHIDEANVFINENKDEMEKFREDLKKIAKSFERYNYIIPVRSKYPQRYSWYPKWPNDIYLSFSEPDENGKGTITGFAKGFAEQGIYGPHHMYRVISMRSVHDSFGWYRDPNFFMYYVNVQFHCSGDYYIDDDFLYIYNNYSNL